MAYDKNVWASGDTVTAAKLNHIENGIEEAASSGGGNPQITLECVNFTSYSHFVNFAIAKWDDEDEVYVAQNMNAYDNTLIEYFLGFAGSYNRYIYDMPIPKGDGMVLLFVLATSTLAFDYSGNIEPGTVTVNFGSVAQAKIITGDCTIRITQN